MRQQSLIGQVVELAKERFDHLKMYFGEEFDVGNGMHILCPTIGDILTLPESDITFYQTLYIWIANPTTYRLMLWDAGVDWNKISDYELFLMLYKTSNPTVTKMLFGDGIDLGEFEILSKTYTETNDDGDDIEKTDYTLYSRQSEIEISKEHYSTISSYLKAAFNIYPKVEKAKGRATKEAIIEEERMNFEAKKKKGEDRPTSSLLPLVSACVNHPGFKYNLEELKNVNFVQFMDSVQRLQIIENTRAMLAGAMSGFADTSKVPKDEFNFMREINLSK